MTGVGAVFLMTGSVFLMIGAGAAFLMTGSMFLMIGVGAEAGGRLNTGGLTGSIGANCCCLFNTAKGEDISLVGILDKLESFAVSDLLNILDLFFLCFLATPASNNALSISMTPADSGFNDPYSYKQAAIPAPNNGPNQNTAC
jgi:hypothetical protein